MNRAERMVRWATAVLGTREGSRRESLWATAAGISPTTAWCSAFIAYGLRKMGVKPPSDPAYSGSWLHWSGGEQIQGGISQARPGDLLIFDWGDGGRTDHVALYRGQGRMISGNDSNNSVGESTVPTSNLVGIVRPKAFADEAKGGGFDAGGALGTAGELGLTAISPLAGVLSGAVPDLVGKGAKVGTDAARNAGAQVVEYIENLLGEKASPILLTIGLVLGGAFLLYFGAARAVGVGQPVRTPLRAARAAAMTSAVA